MPTAAKRVTLLQALRAAHPCHKCSEDIPKGSPAAQVSNHYYHIACLSPAHRKQVADLLGIESGPAPEPIASGPTVTDAQQAVLDALGGLGGGLSEGEIRSIISEEVKTARPVTVSAGGVTLGKVKGKAHALLDEVLRCAAVRLPINLVGPAGSGKSHLGRQVAEGLGLPFYSISCSAGMSEGHLLGRLLPTGEGGRFEYHRSEFVRAYEDGGVFLLDEVDAADANTLLVLNSAISNGHLSVHNRTGNPVAKLHKNFALVTAANTWGNGANRIYCGKNALDGSFNNRFTAATVFLDYDEKLEIELSGTPKLARAFQRIRKLAMKAGLHRIVSMRNTIDFAKTLSDGPNPDGWRTLDECVALLVQSWSPEERKQVGVSSEE